MASALSALPTITATALGASLGTGVAAGQYKAPTAVVGYVVPMDSLNFYVQAQDSIIFNIAATATSTQTSADQVNTYHKGATWYYNIVPTATCTVRFTLQYKDPGPAAFYAPYQTVSLDGFAATQNGAFQVYPGVSSAGSLQAQFSGVLPSTFRIVASITATASGGGASVQLQLDQSKIL